MTDPSTSPLTTTSPSSIDDLFRADPTTLSDADLTRLTIECRRRRNEFASSEAAKAVAPKSTSRKPAPALPSPEAAALDKPITEISLDDFLS